jgi:ParB-like chromosome segregation protein Spo0J
MKVRTVKISDLKINLFVRAQLNAEHALHLAQLMENGVKLPRILVNQDLVIIDGRHRYEAYQLNKVTEIEVEMIEVTDQTELISRAYKANLGGSLIPTKEDTEHTVTLLIERGEKHRAIADLLGLPYGLIRKYVEIVRSKLDRAKLQRAADAVTDGGLTVPKAAEQHGVELRKLKETLSGRIHKPQVGIAQIKRQITSNYRSIASRNSKIYGGILEKYEDGDVTEAQVRSIFKHIEALQERGSRSMVDWKARFDSKVMNGIRKAGAAS